MRVCPDDCIHLQRIHFDIQSSIHEDIHHLFHQNFNALYAKFCGIEFS